MIVGRLATTVALIITGALPSQGAEQSPSNIAGWERCATPPIDEAEATLVDQLVEAHRRLRGEFQPKSKIKIPVAFHIVRAKRGALFNITDQAAAQSGPRSGWYVGGGIGSSWESNIGQEGWNRETTCYPTDACFDADPGPTISGYRWRYDIGAAAGTAFEISVGRVFDHIRLELSLAQRKNDLDQMFRSITEYDGIPLKPRTGGSVVSTSRASINHLTVRTLSLNAYYDFPDAYRGMTPYVGGGLGPTFIEVSGLHFSSDYKDKSDNAPTYDPPLSFYNSRQDADLSNTVLAGHLYAGMDYGLSAQTLLGLKLTYSMLGGFESSGGYSVHPFHAQDADLVNHNRFTGPRSWNLAFTVKRLFGN